MPLGTDPSRDTTGLEAGQRVIWRRAGTADMFAGSIEWINSQKPFPVQVLLDNGEAVLALCDELAPFPPVTAEQIVFQMGSVRISILGRPRLLPGHRCADQHRRRRHTPATPSNVKSLQTQLGAVAG